MAIQREQVLDAALKLLDRVGADGVTMRVLAAELNIQAPSLYWHFANKQALFDAMADRMVAGVVNNIRPGAAWDEVLTAFAQQTRAALLAYRDGGRVFAGTYPVTDNVMRIGDAVIGALVAGGQSPKFAGWAMFTVNYYVIGFVLEEQSIRHGDIASGHEIPAITDALAAHAGDHPITTAALPSMLEADFDERFTFGVEVIVAGLRSRLEADGRSPDHVQGRA